MLKHNKTLTKSNFMTFLNCPRCLWIAKHQSELLPQQDPYQKFIAEQGYEVEDFALQLFAKDEPIQTQLEIEQDGQYVRVDILEENLDSDGYTLYEVKSSGQLTKSKLKEFTYDLAFQANTLQKAGYKISSIQLISPDSNYIKPDHKPVNPSQYFNITDLTQEVQALDAELLIQQAKKAILETDKSKLASICSLNSSISPENCKNHLPEFSIYHLLSRSPKKISLLESQNIYAVENIPDDFPLSSNQTDHRISAKCQSPSISLDLPNFLQKNLQYPLYFFDYESINLAIPRYKGHKPFQQIVFQFSLHIQSQPGAPLQHHEFLAKDTTQDPCIQTAQALSQIIPPNPQGTFIAWHKSFEEQRNNEMATLSPQHSQMFHDINNNLFDLKEVFSKNYYVDYRFKASASIKNVLPVLCPELSYKDLTIQNGTQASLTWYQNYLTTPTSNPSLTKSLLEYCKLDTLAMYRILEKLKSV